MNNTDFPSSTILSFFFLLPFLLLLFLPSLPVLFVFEFLRRLLLVTRGGRKKERVEAKKKKNRAGYVACMWWCIRKGVLRCIREKLHGRKTQTWQKKLRSLLRALVKEKERQGALRNQNWKRWWIRIVAIRIYSIIDITAGWISILASVNLI